MRVLAAQIKRLKTRGCRCPCAACEQESAAVALLAEVAQQLVLQGGHVGGLPGGAAKKGEPAHRTLATAGRPIIGRWRRWRRIAIATPLLCSAIFKSVTGVSIAHYLRRLKLARAYGALLRPAPA